MWESRNRGDSAKVPSSLTDKEIRIVHYYKKGVYWKRFSLISRRELVFE